MGECSCMTVKYPIGEREKQALEGLLVQWRQYTAEDGTHPYADYPQDRLLQIVFEAIMTAGSARDINFRIKQEQYRQGLISLDEAVNDSFPLRLPGEIAVSPGPDMEKDIKEMHDYGYTWEGMLPLSTTYAMDLYDSGLEVYLLYPDGTEAAVTDKSDFKMFEGFCGIEKTAWTGYLKSRGFTEKDIPAPAVPERKEAESAPVKKKAKHR